MRAISRGLLAMTTLLACAGDPHEASGESRSDDEESTDGGGPVTPASGTSASGGATTNDAGTGDSSATMAVSDAGDASTDDAGTSDAADTTTGEPPGTTSDVSGATAATTGPVPCPEADEPNDDEPSATAMGNVGCAGAAIVAASVADGATASDWFSYYGMHDEAACGTNGLPVVTVASGGPLSICAFADCPGGTEVVEVCYAGTPASSPTGLPGCCGIDSVSLDVNCPPTDESATVLVQVDTSVAACTPYELWLEY